jgi:hypothetical protein
MRRKEIKQILHALSYNFHRSYSYAHIIIDINRNKDQRARIQLITWDTKEQASLSRDPSISITIFYKPS